MKRHLIKSAFLLLALLTRLPASSQELDFPFSDGEYGKYGAYYNWHFIWVHSGDIEFFTTRKEYKGQDCWHFKAEGNTFMPYDLLYKVRDTFEVYTLGKPSRPLYFRRVINHGKKESHHQYVFDQEKGLAYSTIKRHAQKLFRDTLDLGTNTHDLLSAAYYFRGFNFRKYRTGQKIPYRLLVDNVIEDLYFRYLGTEIVETRNGRKFRCHKISVRLMEGDFFHEGEYMKVWLTDDRNNVPVQVETEILVGSLKVVLLETKSLRYPPEAEIH
ncbi:MAG: DUF3108 domain-containing protein [Prolixibacteraceae bacterium]|jgi:hypothetical protein|nr:DUF3108 domain-containing protein [Prolixibacteraceae bacterium]